jgi:hypothetical protein
MTDFAATSHGMINNGPPENHPWNLFKHDLCHNFCETRCPSTSPAQFAARPESGVASNPPIVGVRRSSVTFGSTAFQGTYKTRHARHIV